MCVLRGVRAKRPVMHSSTSVLTLLGNVRDTIVVYNRARVPHAIALSAKRVVIGANDINCPTCRSSLPVTRGVRACSPRTDCTLVGGYINTRRNAVRDAGRSAD